jgi:hypothetical protein
MSTHTNHRALCAVVSVLAATAAAAAPAQQTQPGSGPSEASWGMQGDPNQAFKRTCVGDFDGNSTADLVAVRGSQLEILGDPSLFGWSSGYLGSVRDAATLPDPLFDADTVVSVGWNGVQRWSSFEMVHPVTGCSAPTITDLDAQPSEWVGAALVAVGDVAGESAPRIVGVLSDLRSVRTLVHSGTQYVDQALTLSPAPAEDILDLALVDFHADGTPELTLMTTNSLSIYSLSSGLRLAHFAGNPGWSNACMTVGRPGGVLAHWVAMVVNYVDGVQQFLTIVDGDGPNGMMLLQGNPKVVGMTAGSYKDVAEPQPAEGNVDLLLSIDATNKLWVLLNDADVAAPPAFSLDAAHKKVFEYPSTTTGAQSNQAQPALIDFDNDGDLDILHPVRLTSSLFVHWNKTVNEALFRPGVMNDPGNLEAAPVIWEIPSSSSLNLRVLATQPETEPDPIGYRYIEVAVFRKDSIAATTERVADGVWRVPYDPQAETYLFDVELENPELSAPTIPPADGEPVRFENFYILMERVVYRNASNTETLRVLSPRFHGVQTSTANCSQTYCNQEYLDDEADGDPLALTFVACPGCHTYGVAVGTVTPLPLMPTPPASPVIVP